MSGEGSSAGVGAAKAPQYDVHGQKLRSHLEAKPLTFHLRAGQAKWACTLIHKKDLERQRASRTNSEASESSTSSSASSVTGSHH